MSKTEKALKRLFTKPKDYAWDELASLMKGLGFELRTSPGSSRKFYSPRTGALLFLHEPHPGKILKAYQVNDAIAFLTQEGHTP